MGHLKSLAYGRMQGELDHAREEQLRTEEVAAIAHELAGTVNIMRREMPGLDLSPHDRHSFVALANALRLEDDARNEAPFRTFPAKWNRSPPPAPPATPCSVKSRNLLERCKDPRNTC